MGQERGRGWGGVAVAGAMGCDVGWGRFGIGGWLMEGSEGCNPSGLWHPGTGARLWCGTMRPQRTMQ